MGNKMLIDAAHPEETRVVVLRGNRIEEFDFEAASKRQLRGNIYLAKVTRVEPSLQAAFVEYGGNRHGFLAFSEIHPDYYQIPVADRQQLLEDEARSGEDEDEESKPGNGGRRSRRHRRGGGSAEKRSASGDESVRSAGQPAAAGDFAEETDITPGVDDTAEPLTGIGRDEPEAFDAAAGEPSGDDAIAPTVPVNLSPGLRDDAMAEDTAPQEIDTAADEEHDGEDVDLSGDPEGDDDHDSEQVTTLEHGLEAPLRPEGADDVHDDDAQEGEGDAGQEATAGDTDQDEEAVEQLGGDALEDVPHRQSRPRRHYKIQEVIKRRQVLLVQVVKEERGNKGAALTTYLSLAGRYSVLMPNTARGGGISRKIVDPEDRKRLKAIAQELEVPDGMGIILRTAGASRGMPEVKRDFEYLMRMWETVRETTLKSTAPTLVYEEGSLIKRSIRDLFSKEVDEVVVSGEEGYREAREFMRLLMPNQIRKVIAYRDPQPIFAKSGAEAQLDAMFSNQVVLKSGGYLVINQTEALVAIDVNSGRSTREHNIEDTALRTNLEAADEVARQLRLRDLAGLIVVDFIDMEEGRNDRAVERRLKDALKNDRARIQIGRISHFGLLEMSRQRMRTGVLEGSTVMCAHCAGSGMVRSVSSMALHVLRLVEDTLIRSAAYNLIARTRAEVALYILNQKRANLLDLESRFGVSVTVVSDPAMTGMVYHAIERAGEATPPTMLLSREPSPADLSDEDESEGDIDDVIAEEAGEASSAVEPEDEAAAPREPRQAEGQRQPATDAEGGRRRRRRRRRRGRDSQATAFEPGASADGQDATSDLAPDEDEDGEFEPEVVIDAEAELPLVGETAADEVVTFTDESPAPALPEAEVPASAGTDVEDVAPLEAAAPAETDAVPAAAAVPDTAGEAEAEAPRRRRPRRAVRGAATGEAAAAEAVATEEPAAAPARRTRRTRSRPAEPPAEAVEIAEPAEPAAPSADRDVGAEVAKPAPSMQREPELPLAASSANTLDEPATAEPIAPPPPVPEVPPAEPEPDRPKRSGWWQRAKATFTAE